MTTIPLLIPVFWTSIPQQPSDFSIHLLPVSWSKYFRVDYVKQRRKLNYSLYFLFIIYALYSPPYIYNIPNLSTPNSTSSSLCKVCLRFSSLVTEKRASFGSIRLSDWFNRPQILEEGDNFDDLSRGLNTQPQLASDEYHDSEVSSWLYLAPSAPSTDKIYRQ